MTKRIDSKKIKLMEVIKSIDSEEEIDELVKYINLKRLNKLHGAPIFKGMRKSITMEELIKEQNYKGFDREEFDRLVKKLDIQEPIDDLLEMLD